MNGQERAIYDQAMVIMDTLMAIDPPADSPLGQFTQGLALTIEVFESNFTDLGEDDEDEDDTEPNNARGE